jgi:hypothetical protein
MVMYFVALWTHPDRLIAGDIINSIPTIDGYFCGL